MRDLSFPSYRGDIAYREGDGRDTTCGMIGGVATHPSSLTRAAGYAAAVVALLYAAVSVYWALGGQALLSTVGGWVQDLGRQGGAGSVAVGLLAAGLKLAGALMAVALVHPAGRRLPQRPLWGWRR
jgi:hypothetical protein